MVLGGEQPAGATHCLVAVADGGDLLGRDAMMEVLLAIFGTGLVTGLIAGAVLSYFIPAVIAFLNRHPHMFAVFLLNLLLGWTGFGWAAALAWAVVPLTNRPGADAATHG